MMRKMEKGGKEFLTLLGGTRVRGIRRKYRFERDLGKGFENLLGWKTRERARVDRRW